MTQYLLFYLPKSCFFNEISSQFSLNFYCDSKFKNLKFCFRFGKFVRQSALTKSPQLSPASDAGPTPRTKELNRQQAEIDALKAQIATLGGVPDSRRSSTASGSGSARRPPRNHGLPSSGRFQGPQDHGNSGRLTKNLENKIFKNPKSNLLFS